MCSDCGRDDRAYKRQEFRHTKAGPEEIPAKSLVKKKTKTKKKIPKHKHDWEIAWVYDYWSEMVVYCTVCKKRDYWRI